MDLRQTVAQPKRTDIVGDIELERDLANLRSVHLTPPFSVSYPNYFNRWVYPNISVTSRGMKYGNRRCKIKKAKSVFVDKMQFKMSSAKYRLFCSGPIVLAEAWSWISGHGDVIKWKHFPPHWSFFRGIHRSPVDSPHKCWWRGALMFSLICAWTNGWANNRDPGETPSCSLWRHNNGHTLSQVWDQISYPFHLWSFEINEYFQPPSYDEFNHLSMLKDLS